ncbi:MAG UNVERIFIED_CONTAM: hypothetical protein LVT10_14150 [Anaerolineae bacterium]
MNQKFAWSSALAFELESLVTHLFMVNGRVLNAVPPGSLIEVAPKKAARGREADTILILMTPSVILPLQTPTRSGRGWLQNATSTVPAASPPAYARCMMPSTKPS